MKQTAQFVLGDLPIRVGFNYIKGHAGDEIDPPEASLVEIETIHLVQSQPGQADTLLSIYDFLDEMQCWKRFEELFWDACGPDIEEGSSHSKSAAE